VLALSDECRSQYHADMARIGRQTRTTRARHCLREWRIYRNLTQDGLAERMQAIMGSETFDRSRISKFENGHEGLREALLYAFAEALSIEPGWLFVHPEILMREREALTILGNRPPEQIRAVLTALDTLSKAS